MEGNQPDKPNNVRRFKPEPLEISSKTNRPQKSQISDISASSQGSKESYSSGGNTNNRNALSGQASDKAKPPQAVPRFRTGRILPQPTETSSRRSRKNESGKLDDNDREHSSRNAPSPTSSRTISPSVSSGSLTHTSPYRTRTQNEGGGFQNFTSNSPPDQVSNEKAKTRPLRRFLPEPVESTKRSRRRPTGEPESNPARQETPRKFPPQLIGTGKRSFRRAETKQDLDSTYQSRRSTQSSLSLDSDHSASDSEASRSFPSESRFSYANLLQRQEGRRHSFRVPDLPDIQSNSSEDSDDSDSPSRSTSPSRLSQKDTKFSTMNDQFRESCDERFSSYLLSLAARCAEKQLRDQALAAFPNEQVYQSVSHFAIDGDEDSDNERKTFRRESTTDLTWELEEMRRHKEIAESKDVGQQGREGGELRFSAAAIASRQLNQSTPFFKGWEKDNGLKHMRHAASPPMLGHDIVFPMSVSPQGTTHEDDEDAHRSEERRKTGDGGRSTGLWTSYPHGDHRNENGLWGGLCRKDEDPDISHIRTGIVTPRKEIEGDSYFSLNQAAHLSPGIQHPTKPSDQGSHLSHVDKMSGIETDIEREFHDGFVSQVYNYLSLGYPSLARYYDHELSKISGISIEDLRKDDLHADAKGYVGVPDRSRVDKDRTILDKCMRWSALRLYIREWAKQRPEMVSNGESLDAWGVRERRGSWAI